MISLFLFTTVLLYSSNAYSQNDTSVDTISVSSNVGFVGTYKKILELYIRRDYSYKIYGKKNITFYFPVRIVKYSTEESIVRVSPLYNNQTKLLYERLTTCNRTEHDSILYAYIKDELHPYHRTSGGCRSYCISPLQRGNNHYYVDLEEVYGMRGLEKGERGYTVRFNRFLWVDSCRYIFSVYDHVFKKHKIPKRKRELRASFQQVVSTIFIRPDEELVELREEE